MTMNKHNYILLLLLTSSLCIYSQGGTLSSSPYSLFGLGSTNNINSGKTNALGNTGIAMSDRLMINSLNPAALSSIAKHQFIYDIGLKFQYGFLNQSNKNERRINSNFSNISLALKATERSAFGISIKPKTDVGYIIRGIEKPIEGSSQTFLSDIFGSGGVNNLNLTYAYSANQKLRLGISTSFLFGLINESESNFIPNSFLLIEDKNNYRGVQLNFGIQYDILKNTTFGFVANTRSTLIGSRERIVSQPDVESIVTDEENIDSFDLPLEIGFGLSSLFKDRILINLDYKRSFWDATNQVDQVGEFIDQNFLGLGAQYIPRKNGLKYWDRAQYRFGFNLDTGYLKVNEQTINGYQLTTGIGLPLNRNNTSLLNLSYSYQKNGLLNNGLIKETYHTLTINLSLSNTWLKRRVID